MIRQVVAAVVLLASSCAWAGGRAVMTGDEAATKAAAVTRDYELSKDKTECLLFDTADKGGYFLVRVRENHTDACGGAAGFSPVLFFLKIRKSDGYTLTTAYDSERYRQLRSPGKK